MTDEQEMELSAESEDQSADRGQGEAADAAGQDADGAAQEADVADVGVAVAEDTPSQGGDEANVVNEGNVSEGDDEAAMLDMLQNLPEDDSRRTADDINFGSTPASKAEFQQLQQPVTAPESRNIELLMDVDLPISIELGRTKMSIADILAMGPGSVVELNKLAGEPVDLLVNQKVVARGEVVVIDENFGLRITQLMTPEERLRALAEE